MKKRYLLWGLGVLFLMLNACRDEEGMLEPSYADKNWFQVADKPGELNQLLYEIYTETGMPIFVNDTLGEENYATTMAGEEMHRYERFNLSYILFGTMADQLRDTFYTRYAVESDDTAAMILAAELLRDKVIPNLPKTGEGRPICYFVVDSIMESTIVRQSAFSKGITFFYEIPVYVASKGVACGGIEQLDEMTEEERDIWCGRILGAKASAWISEYMNLELWYAITTENTSFRYNAGLNVPNALLERDVEEEAGWFGYHYHFKNETFEQYHTYSEEVDVREYVARIYAFRGRENEYLSRYAPESKVYRKFEMMMNFVEEFEEYVNWNVK